MNKCLFSAMIGLLFSVSMSSHVSAAEVQTLRGGAEISAPSISPKNSKWMHDQAPILRQYVQQPPVIPHKVEGYKINKKSNKCLTCHSWANYKNSGATKVSLTHFVDRDGVEHSNIAARRYFCLQCHVPQRQVAPLVGNKFEPIDLLDRH